MSRTARRSLELVWIPAGGRERRLRVGRRVLVGVFVLTMLLVASLLLFAAVLPSLVSRARLSREMDVALARRVQLGERLRALVEHATQLDRQIQAHAARVDRIRALYGLPELGGASEPAHATPRVPRTIFAAAILYADQQTILMRATLDRADASVAVLARWESEHSDEARAVPALLPLPAADLVMVAGFGPGRDPVTGVVEFHAGLDLAAPEGDLVRAPSAGVVRWAGDAPTAAGTLWWRLGHLVVIAHGTRYLTLYGHCGKLLVHQGQHVSAGEPIATVGASGRTASPRLHYEIRQRTAAGNWDAVDPRRLLLDLGPLAAPVPAPKRFEDGETPTAPPLPSVFVR